MTKNRFSAVSKLYFMKTTKKQLGSHCIELFQEELVVVASLAAQPTTFCRAIESCACSRRESAQI